MSTAASSEPGLTPIKFSRLTRRGVLLGLSGPQLVMASLAVALPFLAWQDFPQVALQKVLLWVWLVMYSLIFLAAPLYAYKSFRTFTPDDELPTLAPGFKLSRGGSRAV